MKTLRIVCETPGCTNLDKKINVVIFDEGPQQEDLISTFIENFGTGTEDPKDFCPICKKLGVLKKCAEDNMAKKAEKKFGIEVRCPCGHVLGRFAAEDDNSGVIMQCPVCLKPIYISNGEMTELEEEPESYDHPEWFEGYVYKE